MTELKQLRAKPARVRYIDLCEHSCTTTQDFFAEAGLAVVEVYGLTVEMTVRGVTVLKVLFYDGIEADEESQGIVIPISCVEKLDYFTEVEETIEDPFADADLEVN